MGFWIRSFVVLLISAWFGASALAEDYYVEITNKTGFTIYYMYVSPAESTDWEEDLLGEDVLMNGTKRRVNLNGYSSPVFDIKLVDEDGDSYTFWKVDVSKKDIVVRFEDMDKK